eukprot:gene12187-5774_t
MSSVVKHFTNTTKFSKLTKNDNFFLSIDKPKGITSFDVIRRIRKKNKDLKLGHCGTLDPLATGLLILAANKATKRIDEFKDLDKSYTFTMKMGEQTSSYDSDTPVTHTSDLWKKISKDDILEVVSSMVGDVEQEAPAYSAIKVKGKRLYELARNNEIIEQLPVRKITIHSIELLELKIPFAKFLVKCGKGTYIRSICNDIGKALKCYGHVTELRRESIGDFKVTDAFKLDDFLTKLDESNVEEKNCKEEIKNVKNQ